MSLPRRLALLALFFALPFAALAAPGVNTPADYGAIGDGKADDTRSVQAAVDASKGGLWFPKGVYRLTQPVVIDLDRVGFTSLSSDGTARIVMAGAGPAFKFVGTHKGTAEPKSFQPDVWEGQRTPMVEGLEIVGAHAEADGIEASGTMQLTITRVTVREARHGIHLTVRNRNIIISDCHIYHNSGIGIYYDNVDLHQSNIIGSHISYNAGGGVVSRGSQVRNLQIGTCDIESNMTPDGPPGANVLLDCTGGSIAEVAIVGCTLQHNNQSPGSANVRFLGQGTPAAGIEQPHWGHLTIADNVLTDVAINVELKQARGVVIHGNTFGPGHEHDLLVEECSNIVVGANTFDRNPPYFTGKLAKAQGGLVFRKSRDCTLTALHVNGVRNKDAAVLLEECDAFNISDCMIFDSDGAGLFLRDVTRTRVGGCVIRARVEGKPGPGVRVTGGKGNWITQNLLENGYEVPAETARVDGNYDGK
jgi:hypothetical protein